MKEKVKAKLKELGISTVYLFGSKATGVATPLSDIDIGIVLKNASALKKTKALYNTLYGLFSEIYPSSKLDIVFLQASSLPIQYHTIKERAGIF